MTHSIKRPRRRVYHLTGGVFDRDPLGADRGGAELSLFEQLRSEIRRGTDADGNISATGWAAIQRLLSRKV
jgi:hypothetical protein